jgi:hypothetical protein
MNIQGTAGDGGEGLFRRVRSHEVPLSGISGMGQLTAATIRGSSPRQIVHPNSSFASIERRPDLPSHALMLL